MELEITERFKNKFWRLNNLYWIIDKSGKRVLFNVNEVQERLFDELWYMNIVLKARQFGVTTFTDLYFLDEVIFNPNVEAGIIAHNKEDAQKIFRRKIQYPYRNLPEGLKKERYPITDSRQELALNNNSVIYVGTSMRSGTLQYLHVSEHGKICKKYPEKAEEIKTGSLNAVEAGQMVVIESTAEGAVGDFFDFCQVAYQNKISDRKLTPLDFKFHFFPWFMMGEYAMDIKGVDIPERLEKYFNNLERSLKITLSPQQRAWYAKKESLMGYKMKQEYPSTVEEAFEGAKSAFYFSRDHHVIEPIDIPKTAQLYFTFDYGYGAPYSCGWWWVDMDGRVYRFSELYGADSDDRKRGLRHTDDKIAELIIQHEKKLDIGIWDEDKFGNTKPKRNVIRLCDPTCFNKKPNYLTGGQGPSTAEVFASYKLYVTPGDPSRELKLRQFALRLRLHKDIAPMMQVYDTCKDFIRTIPLLQLDDKNPNDIDTNGDDHGYDDACHICMARPIKMEKPKRRKSSHERRIEQLYRGDRDTYIEHAEHEQRQAFKDIGYNCDELDAERFDDSDRNDLIDTV